MYTCINNNLGSGQQSFFNSHWRFLSLSIFVQFESPAGATDRLCVISSEIYRPAESMLFWARVTQSKVWRKTTTHTSTKSIQLYIMHWLVLKWYVLCTCMYVMLREVDLDYFVTEHDMHVVAFISLSNIICGVDKIFDTRYMTCFFSPLTGFFCTCHVSLQCLKALPTSVS